jgi:hypothetical protein
MGSQILITGGGRAARKRLRAEHTSPHRAARVEALLDPARQASEAAW